MRRKILVLPCMARDVNTTRLMYHCVSFLVREEYADYVVQARTRTKKVLFWLGLIFLFLSIIWFFVEYFDLGLPMEPIVVFVGGSATLLASYWPFKTKNRSRPLTGKEPFDYKTNDGYFTIGSGDNEFVLSFARAAADSIHMYNGLHKTRANTDRISLAGDAGKFEEVKDVTEFDYTSNSITPKIGEIVALRSKGTGRYALVQILDIKYQGRNGADTNEVVFRYVINTNNCTSFA